MRRFLLLATLLGIGCGDDSIPVSLVPDAARGATPDAGDTPSAGVGGSDAGDTPNTAGGGGVLADSSVPDLPPGDASDDAAPPGYCGDQLRDPTNEECDDGPGISVDLCTAECSLRDLVFAQVDANDSDEPHLTLGSGPHPVAAGDEGFAVVYVRTVNDERSVWIARFDPWGSRLGSDIEMSAGSDPAPEPDPVVAALPGGAYVVAWSDSGSGTPDVRLRAVNATGALDVLGYAHQGTSGTQQTPDLLWTADQLIIGYSGNFDIRTVTLDGGLNPLVNDAPLVVSSTLDTSVALAPFGDGYAAAWRDNDAGAEWIHVRSGVTQWAVGPVLPVPEVDRPRIAQLDEERLLLVFGEGTDPDMTGMADIPRLRWAVLAVGNPGNVDSFALDPLVAAYEADPAVWQREPALSRVGDHLYLSWQTGPLDLDVASEVWWTEILVETEPDAMVRTVEQALPFTALSQGTRAQPALAASPLAPEGALVVAWEATTDVSASDLMVALRPSPFLD